MYGRRLKFLSEHEPQKTLKHPLGRVGRLLYRLQGVDYEIRYVKRINSRKADFISRVEHPGIPLPVEVNLVEFELGIQNQSESSVGTSRFHRCGNY